MNTSKIKKTTSKQIGQWENIRSKFPLSKDQIHLSQLWLTAHPEIVQNAIDFHRIKLDENSVDYVKTNHAKLNWKVAQAAAKYLATSPGEIALTDSTTMGLAVLYFGLKLKPGDDILTSTHTNYSSITSLSIAAQRSNADLRTIDLYQNSSETSVDEILGNVKKAILPKTRIVALTYVHSCTGVKLPIAQIAAIIKEINHTRSFSERIYFSVDGVHGFGIENITAEELGCDFFIAGTHKWIFGPRGTGIMWAKKDAWEMVDPIIPPYSIAYEMWKGFVPTDELDFFSKITPGGFHTFEYRWALKEAFEFHLEIGKENIQHRTHELSTILKEGLMNIPHIRLHTPYAKTLSSGINCFEVEGMHPNEVIKKLHQSNIFGSTTPYQKVYARLSPSILNSEDEIGACIKALENIYS